MQVFHCKKGHENVPRGDDAIDTLMLRSEQLIGSMVTARIPELMVLKFHAAQTAWAPHVDYCLCWQG